MCEIREVIHKAEKSRRAFHDPLLLSTLPWAGVRMSWVLRIKITPPLAGVRLPLKQESVWRPRTLGAPISTLPASHPIPDTQPWNIRTNFIIPFIPVDNRHNEKPKSLLIPPTFMPKQPLSYFFLDLTSHPLPPSVWSPFSCALWNSQAAIRKIPFLSDHSLYLPTWLFPEDTALPLPALSSGVHFPPTFSNHRA